MKLKRLLKSVKGIDVKGSKEIEISGISNHSKRIAPGSLFIAKKGLSHDGSEFIEEAIETGAVAVLTDMYNPFLKKSVVQLVAKDPTIYEGIIADEFYEHPSKDLFVVGITGTSGKTTTSYIVHHLLSVLKGKTGLIGTVEWLVADQVFTSSMTTPDVITNHKLLYDMRQKGCSGCVMEVSSHALVQSRVEKIDFDVAIFTNLSQDHLDYHKDMQDYARAKALLFSSLKDLSKTAIINRDDPYSDLMIEDCRASIMTYGIENTADLMAKDIILREDGMSFNLLWKAEQQKVISNLIGKFNVYNLLAAAACGLRAGYSLEKIAFCLSSFTSVPGRMQRVENDKKLHIFVDYSHKPDALENVLKTLNHIKKGKLICVFGCGGDRDKSKRPMMGKIAHTLSDEVIITSDNPRSEDPLEIIDQILQGIDQKSNVSIEPDRQKAIKLGVDKLCSEDILLIAGKGHETYQMLSQGKVFFDDRVVARECCK